MQTGTTKNSTDDQTLETNVSDQAEHPVNPETAVVNYVAPSQQTLDFNKFKENFKIVNNPNIFDLAIKNCAFLFDLLTKNDFCTDENLLFSLEDILQGDVKKLGLAYKKLLAKYHPDQNQSTKESEEFAKKITHANEFLQNFANACKILSLHHGITVGELFLGKLTESKKEIVCLCCSGDFYNHDYASLQIFSSNRNCFGEHNASFQSVRAEIANKLQNKLKLQHELEKLKAFQDKIEKLNRPELQNVIKFLQDPALIKNLEFLVVDGETGFDSNKLYQLINDIILKDGIDPAILEARIELLDVLKDRSYILNYNFNGKDATVLLDNIRNFLNDPHLKVSFTDKDKQPSVKQDVLARSNLTIVEKFHLYDGFLRHHPASTSKRDNVRALFNNIALDDPRWECIQHCFEQHKKSAQTRSQDTCNKPWLQNQLYFIGCHLTREPYFQVVNTQVLGRISNQEDAQNTKKAGFATEQKKVENNPAKVEQWKKKIEETEAKITHLREGRAEIRAKIVEKVYSAANSESWCKDLSPHPDSNRVSKKFTTIMACRFQETYENGNHLQNDIDTILEKHSTDPKVKTSSHPAKDIFREILGGCIAFLTAIGIVTAAAFYSSRYRDFVGSFFKTKTETVLHEAGRDSQSTAERIGKVYKKKITQAEFNKEIHTILQNIQPPKLRGG